MVNPVPPRWHRRLITGCAIPLLGLPLLAQRAPEPSKYDPSSPGFDEPIFAPFAVRPPANEISVGVRMSGGAKLKFKNLGTISFGSATGGLTDGSVNRAYRDGGVAAAAGALVGSGFTNIWNADSSKGATVVAVSPLEGDVATERYTGSNNLALVLHDYAAITNETTQTESNGSSVSWDLEYAHRLGGRKISWGIMIGAGLSDINAHLNSTLSSKVLALSHYYSLWGQNSPFTAENPNYVAPHSGQYPLTDENGNPILDKDGNPILGNRDDSILLRQQPFRETYTYLSGKEAQIVGHWEVKGSYITTRIGPYFETRLGRHWALKGSAGATVTILGAHLRVDETAIFPAELSVPDLTLTQQTSDTRSTKFGLFGSGEINYLLTDRTGVFLGAVYESYSATTLIVAGGVVKIPGLADIPPRTIVIDTSSGLGWRLGITTHF